MRESPLPPKKTPPHFQKFPGDLGKLGEFGEFGESQGNAGEFSETHSGSGNYRMHMKYLKSQSPHAAATIIKVWQGAAMTKSQHHKLDPSKSPECECGHGWQDVNHLVFHCPLHPTLPFELSTWITMPPAYSVALLAPLPATTQQKKTWPLLCDRAVKILSGTSVEEGTLDWKGHEVERDHDNEYAYCIRCFVTRRISDARHIAARPCKGLRMGVECCEGSYTGHKGHFLRLGFRAWKRAARRPAFTCAKCAAWSWPSSRFSPCPF